MPRVRVAAAQINAVVGDLDGNVARILAAYEQAEGEGADLVVFPELTVTGYPPEDLLLRTSFVTHAGEAVDKLAVRTGRCVAV
ncbi:MAG TPA: nitrilase-related carbon-nitrogen hydrolase, partial [Acidimicrobiia bacterium]|nr:nitrilase-related carbon-nitrogen hydrolase [Acidimicrobiia bacterium]